MIRASDVNSRYRPTLMSTVKSVLGIHGNRLLAPPPRLEHFDPNSINRDGALRKDRHFRSSLFGCDLKGQRCELSDARNHFFGEQRDIFHRLPMRHVADMQVQNDLAALRLLAPERDAFGNLVWRAEHRSDRPR
jgi:hypothetical protein